MSLCRRVSTRDFIFISPSTKLFCCSDTAPLAGLTENDGKLGVVRTVRSF
jgi:hypothetical protein